MPLYLGEKPVAAAYLASVALAKAYLGDSVVSGGALPPPGFAWLTDFEGNAVFDSENNRLYGAI